MDGEGRNDADLVEYFCAVAPSAWRSAFGEDVCADLAELESGDDSGPEAFWKGLQRRVQPEGKAGKMTPTQRAARLVRPV